MKRGRRGRRHRRLRVAYLAARGEERGRSGLRGSGGQRIDVTALKPAVRVVECPLGTAWRHVVMSARARILAVLLMLTGCDPSLHGKGEVIGGIVPCQVTSFSTGPKYVAGSVTVLMGRVTWRPISPPGASEAVFPTSLIARQTVDQ